MEEETKTITLKKPITIGPATYAALELREPTCAEMEEYEAAQKSGGDLKAIRILVAKVTGYDKEVIARVGISQVMEAGRFLTDFIPGGPATGDTSPPT